MEILRKANNLKGTNLGADEDFTKEVQEERRKLVSLLRETREKGATAVLRYNKLIIDGEVLQCKQITKPDAHKITEVEKSREGKRKIWERSPKRDSIDAQLSKMTTRTNPKN